MSSININNYKNFQSFQNIQNKKNDKVRFKNALTLPIKLSPGEKAARNFISIKEGASALSILTCAQDTITNWLLGKVPFTRSKADFVESTFLEFSESILFYFAFPLLGGALKPVFSKGLHKDLKNLVVEPAKNLLTDKKFEAIRKSGALKKVLPVKAGIVLACAAIPLGEYALSFAKNLLTLKLFGKADFADVIGFNKNKQDSAKKAKAKERVEKGAKKNILGCGIAAAVSLVAGIGLAAFGHKSKALQSISKVILQPGSKIYDLLEKVGIKSKKLKNGLNKYLNFDFDKNGNKFSMSHGQLTLSCAFFGLSGYAFAAKDRGKLDLLEVLSRVPFVVVYTVFGSSALEHYYKKYLLKNHNKQFSKLIDKKDLSVKKLEDLAKIAKSNTEYKQLLKRKALIVGVPYGFALAVMGVFLGGMSRFWTKYRYKHGVGADN